MDYLANKKRSFKLSGKQADSILFVICLACMSMFLFSAYEKIVDHERFYAGLSKVAIIGSYAHFISWAVPITEILISVLLIIPSMYKQGLYAFIGLMVLFTTYIVIMWIWAEKLPCHCNLIVEKLTWGEHILFNLAFIALGIIGVRLKSIKI